MQKPAVGIIGGSGLGDTLGQQTTVQEVAVETPFGAPSGPLLKGEWHGCTVYFLNRHGPGHLLCPSGVPYRANIYALKSLGVTHVLASGAVGSLREDIEPAHLVVCDQVIDKTHQRVGTFFDRDLAVHVECADPFCDELRKVVLACAGEVDTKVHERGTYVVMEGPQFSTRAESHMHRAWGGDLIGMTCMPEAKLAREAEMSYALIALATDYDCWRPTEAKLDRHALLREIIGNLQRASAFACQLIEATVKRLGAMEDLDWPAHHALELAIWSDRAQISRAARERLQPLLGKYLDNA